MEDPLSKLRYEVKNEIAYITLNRPEKRNAIDDELSHELLAVWPRFEKDADGEVSEDRRESASAQREKREPRFTGR
jgi:1,4-dihydroxy-2-naphthoyl-CoA synthase